MNKNIKLAVAGAVLALSATANAGIIIPAGDWTVDLGGNMNAFLGNVDTETTTGAGVRTKYSATNTIGTGLLPAALGIGAKTRQNDIDTAIQFTFFTGTSSGDTGLAQRNGSGAGNNTLNIRQSFLTFGDKSWGTFKLGRDLGIYGSDAILSDMTLLGVGTGGAPGGSSTLGRIGSGYIYADWKGQVSYSTPNFNGFQVSIGAMENFGAANQAKRDMSYEAKATYDFTSDGFSGRFWVSGLSQKSEASSVSGNTYTSRGVDVGLKASAGPASIVGYYYDGKGLDGQNSVQGIFNRNGVKSDDDGGYVQATYALPTQTKLGVSFGRSNSKHTVSSFDIENESWVVGAYHPLTKHLNLVAEYTAQEIKNKLATGSTVAKTENDTIALGAILFF